MVRRLAMTAMAAMALGMLLPATPTLAQAAPTCRFQLGFAALQRLLPMVVGQCLDDARYSASGDAVQHATNGLLAWRKLDNWTAFTDGNHTWINGPNGVQERLNSQHFSWEANPAGLPAVNNPVTSSSLSPTRTPPAPTAIRTISAAAVSTAGLTALPDPTLISVNGAAGVLAWVRNDAATALNAQLVAMLTTTGGGLVGQAKAPLINLQPGERKLVELTSVAKVGAVTGLRFQFTAVANGRPTPTVLTLGAVQVDPSDPNYVLVPVTNTDATAHSGFISVAVTSAAGVAEGIAYGSYSHLNPGLSTTVRCISLLGPIPPGAQVTAQVDTAL